MQIKAFAAILATLLAGTTPTLAQDDTTAAPEGTEPSVDFPLGQDPTSGPAPGEAYLAEEHGDWELRCIAVEQGLEPCQLYQVLTDGSGGSVAEIVIFPLDQGQAVAGALVTTPLETLLTEQVTIAVDGGDGRSYPFSFCSDQGCVSRIGLTTDDLANFRQGVEARVRIVPARAPDQTVILTASLRGFTAGFAAMEARLPN